LTLPDEFEFEFANVICTDLLLQNHKSSSTVLEIDVLEIRGLFDRELRVKLMVLKQQFERTMVF
jgi:hypothetical protein